MGGRPFLQEVISLNTIELENWKQSEEDPGRLEYAGQRTAMEVYEDLRCRLESIGYLPDEYFLMDPEWEQGREIPKGADLFCTTDYGASEGVYLDVYLKWYEDGKPITKSFITGKTLGETGSDLDRMFLISAAITKAFHGDGAEHARYMRLGGPEPSQDMILHLKPAEQRIFIDALVEQRERMVENVLDTEKLLRRMTGGILAYMEEVGHRPLRVSAYDQAVLAIHDSDLAAFRKHLPDALEHADELLVQTAGRTGSAGREMLRAVLDSVGELSPESYLSACQKAAETGDAVRLELLMEQASAHIPEMQPSFCGDMILTAYSVRKNMGEAMIRQAPPEQIAEAQPRLFQMTASNGELRDALLLLEKGIDTSGCAASVMKSLYGTQNEWKVWHLLEQGMRVLPEDYAALNQCVAHHDLDCAKLLLDRGMDFEGYRAWLDRNGETVSDAALRELDEHWQTMRPPTGQQAAGPVMGGMRFG